jgi:hypothetical protein
MLAAAVAVFGVLFLAVCWMQRLSPVQGALALVYQGGNLTKLEFSEYEYSPRADIARVLANGGGALTPEQGAIAVGLHGALSVVAAALVGLVLFKAGGRPRTDGLLFGLICALMLVVSPSAHEQYYVFLLITWTALAAELLRRGWSRATLVLWAALVAGYVGTGFDQPFFLMQRLFGFGLIVPRNWLPWHLPTLGLLLTMVATAAALLSVPRAPVDQPERPEAVLAA